MQLDRNNPLPLYEQLKNVIADKIKNGEFQPGQQIPSERELCEQFDVSRITVRQAISLAVNEGLLYRTHGKGTFVCNPKIRQGLTKVNRFQEALAQQGLIASTRLLGFHITLNHFYLSRILHIDIMHQIANLQLVGLGNEDPIVFYDSYFSDEIGQKMNEEAKRAVQQKRPFSTLDLYGEKIGVLPTHAEQTFEATVSNESVSHILQIPQGSPILLVSSIVYSHQQPVEYRQAYYRGDKYKFFITREYDPEMFRQEQLQQKK